MFRQYVGTKRISGKRSWGEGEGMDGQETVHCIFEVQARHKISLEVENSYFKFDFAERIY